MSQRPDEEMARDETAPGEQSEQDSIVGGVRSYVVGLIAAAILTTASFALVQFDIVWGPAVPAALVALAIGQMGCTSSSSFTSPPGRTTATTCWRCCSAY